MDERQNDVLQEAVVVGLLFVPLHHIVSTATLMMGITPSYKAQLDVGLSAVVFHLLAEDSGLNDWYIHNGSAQKRSLGIYSKRNALDGWVRATNDDYSWVGCL